MAEVPPQITALSALLRPLQFAARGAGRNAARLAAFEPLVVSTVNAARGRVGDDVLDELMAVAKGFDAGDVDDKRARVARMLDLVQGAANASTANASTAQASAVTPLPRVDVMAVPVTSLKGMGPRRVQSLAERGLLTVGDLLFTLPRTYEDRRGVKRIADLETGALAVVSGTVIASGAVGMAGRGRRYEVAVDDGSGQLRLVFFHFRPQEMHKRFARGAVVTASGEVQSYGPRMQMIHPRVSSGARVEELGGVQPVYPELRGLHPLELARCVAAALEHAKRVGVVDALPEDVKRAGAVPDLGTALSDIHAPADDVGPAALRALLERSSPGHKRLAFEELFVLGTALALRRRAGHEDPAPALAASDGEDAAVARLLPFTPTAAQARAIREVFADLTKPVPMARLLQGDVGSGKTAVAAAACLRAVRAGHQAAFMAPTELLAEQHARTLMKLFSPLGVRVGIITGSVGKKARAIAEARLRNRDLDIAVGTQALLSEGVEFARLGLCVVDEQHRFGVVQRAALRAKGPRAVDAGGVGVMRLAPHLLVMTATPIPRSLALTVYGDLAVSVLDEMPPGRTPVKTEATRDVTRVYAAVADVLARGERAFVVYPLIDESEKIDLAAASAGYQELRAVLASSPAGAAHVDAVALLHGRMKAAEREKTMAAFARGDVKVLVSTTVVEVGVDVPEATLMAVMNAERFGLAQLHQLRGRVGRSARPSRCILVVAGGGGFMEDAMRRVHILTTTNDGFRIAEEDLAMRGPGDVLGTRQSGVPSLAFSDLVKNAPLIELTRALADRLVDGDPLLQKPEHAGLRKLVLERYAARLALTAAG